MKQKSFVLRLVSLVVIVAALLAYNRIATNRLEAEAYLTETVTAGDVLPEQSGNAVSDGSPLETTTAPSGGLQDGTYEGEAQGYGGPVKVSVVISGGKIVSVGVLSHEQEDDTYYSMAEAVIPAVIEAQSTAVDTVSGATFSSNGILGAIDRALEGAVN